MRRLLALGAFGILSLGCPGPQVIPDPNLAHQVAKETEVVIWALRPDGKWQKQEVRLPVGWWVAGPPAVDAP